VKAFISFNKEEIIFAASPGAFKTLDASQQAPI